MNKVLLTTKETAKICGITRRTLYRWINNSYIPVKQIGKKYYFVKTKIKEWLLKER